MSDETPKAAADATSDAAPAANENEQLRRNFMTQVLAAVIGGVVGLVPFVCGLVFFLDPLLRRKKGGAGKLIKVAIIDSLPASGAPQIFKVIADKSDAWNKYPKQPIGSVFLRKLDDGKVTAFHSSCPHLGCTVDYKTDTNSYKCPCHESSFKLDGKKTNDIAPRDLDSLDVEIRNGNEIWVKFENFRATTAEKIPIS